MFLVHVDVAALRLLRQSHLLLELLIDLTATERRNLELDRVDLIAEVTKLADESLVAAPREVSGLVDPLLLVEITPVALIPHKRFRPPPR